jgi:DNA-binding IclR family transcriptional regulator
MNTPGGRGLSSEGRPRGISSRAMGLAKRRPRPTAAPARAGAERYRIQALDRAAAVLNCFESDPELNVRDVAERTGLHKSTAHRILMALQHNGFVEQDARSGRYHLGLQLVKLGEHAVQRLDVRMVARPFLEDLAAKTGETVHLAVLDGDQVVMLDRVEGLAALSTPSLPGRLFPVHCTSLGKAILAGLEDADVRRLLGHRGLKRLTARTLPTVDALLDDLRGVRRRGYASTEDELELGLSTVGAAIRDRAGDIVAAISIGGPSPRLRTATMAAVGERVKRTADLISAQLGYRVPAAPAAGERRPSGR